MLKPVNLFFEEHQFLFVREFLIQNLLIQIALEGVNM